jgi:hypothetical protein
MKPAENLIGLKMMEIDQVKPGQTIVNLGMVLEVFESDFCYEFVVERMNEKQVLKFEKQIMLFLTES